MLTFIKTPEPAGKFEADMRKWGVIQALVVQQDAAEFLAKILQGTRLKPNCHADLKLIRDDLRNRYVGHPVRDHHSEKFVVIAASGHKEASFIELCADGINVRRFDLRKLIEKQISIISDFIINLKAETMSQEENFRRSLRVAKPLDVVRNSTFSYNVGKADPECSGMHLHHAKEIQRELDSFRQAFETVGRLNQFIRSDLDLMDYASAQVISFHDAESSAQRLTGRDVSVFLAFLASRYEQLLVYVDEIENEIQTPVS